MEKESNKGTITLSLDTLHDIKMRIKAVRGPPTIHTMVDHHHGTAALLAGQTAGSLNNSMAKSHYHKRNGNERAKRVHSKQTEMDHKDTGAH